MIFDDTRRARLRWRKLVSHLSYLEQNTGKSCRLAEESEVVTPIPQAFPEEGRRFLVSPHERYTFPQIFVFEISSGLVHGGSNLVLVDDFVLHHDLYDFTRDSTSEELHGRTLIDPKKGRIRWLLHDDGPEQLPLAAVFTDACAANYAHWLTEVLPRIAMFCGESKFANVPVIVDAGLHRNLMESLLLIAGEEREIICLPVGRAIAVEQLYITSVCGYVPFGRRSAKLKGHSHGMFSQVALGRVRTKLIEAAQIFGVVELPDKIYLRRTSGTRKVTNAFEVEKLVESQGYAIVEPEKLNFLEQVRLFSNVKGVVASSGAALANVVFCASGTEIRILISAFADTSYWYWQNIACATGNRVQYILGISDPSSVSGIHADFKIDPINFMFKEPDR